MQVVFSPSSWVAVALLAACSSNSANPPVNLGSGGTGTGGVPGTGGAVASGTGGVTGTGGASGTGGQIGSGGTSAGGRGGGTVVAATGGSIGTGGGTRTGGSTGAGGSIGGGGGPATGFGIAGPSRCATAGVQLCESFENGLSATIWNTTQSGDGTAVVDAVHAARGTRALHVKTTAGNGHAFITERMTFPAPANVLYGRMFVYLGDALTTDGHFTFAEGDGTGNGAGIRFGGQNKFLGVGTDGGASGDWTDKDNKLIPAQTWMCLEFQFKGDTNVFHGWWDDVERTALNRGVAQHAGFAMPQFTSLWFGYWMYNMIEPQELWIDEIAVDTKPIGCVK
jgi:hypothetical protein